MTDNLCIVIRRKKRSIFLEANESTPISEIKKMIEGIIKVPVYNQRLYMDDGTEMDDDKILRLFGITAATAKPSSPKNLGLCIKLEDGTFEEIKIVPYSVAPDFPDIMKVSLAVNSNDAEMGTSDSDAPAAN